MEGAGTAGARRSKARGGGRSSGASGIGLRGTGRPPEGPGGTLVAPVTRREDWFGRRRAETATATWTAARGFGRGGERRYGAETRGRREGKQGDAHGDHAEQHSGVGEDLVTANRRRRTAEPEEEDEGDSGDGGRPEVRGLTRR